MQRGSAAQTDRPDAAIVAFNEALVLRPGNEQALLGVGQAMQRRGDLSGAQTKYEEVLKDSPNNADALAGLAFVRLGQKDFDSAAQLFARARAVESDRRDVDEGYRTATFWRAMQHGAAALSERRPDAAVASYREALAIDAGSKDALAGLADATRLSGKLPEAIKVYQQLAAADSSDVRGWLGLIRTSLASRDGQGALQIASTIPASTRKSLEANPEYLALVAQALYRTNQRTAGDQALRTALDVSARSDSDAAMNARLEIAGLLMEQGNDANAALVYKRVTEAHSDNTPAWEGLIRAYARSHEFSSASAALGSMPRIAHDAAIKSASFLKVIATVYTVEGRCVEAESLLTRSIDLDRAAGRSLSDTQLQLAGVWALEGRHDRATQGYSDVLAANPQSGDAWRGYIAALRNDKKDYSALAAIDRIPAAVRTDLLKDSDFLRLLASVHSANGNNDRAIELLQQARSSRRALGQPTPIDLDVQLAWAMFDSPKHSAEVPALVTEMRVRSGTASSVTR
jgi:tetratricopeptide (TPR) repeat protein